MQWERNGEERETEWGAMGKERREGQQEREQERGQEREREGESGRETHRARVGGQPAQREGGGFELTRVYGTPW